MRPNNTLFNRWTRKCRSLAIIAALSVCTGPSLAAAPFADMHTHYKWTQADVTSAAQAIAALRENETGLAVVIGLPADNALRLQELAPDIIVPFWSPYRKPGDWSTWAFDAETVERANQALKDSRYRGIGELHLIGGFAPSAESPVISGLLDLAGEHDIPVMIHTEISTGAYMRALCSAHPGTQIIWAHAGSILPAGEVATVLDACPNLWAELAARDPWRFVNNPIVTAQGRLQPDWRDLILAHQDRVVTGSDPVWPVERMDSWDEPDTGWEQYARFVDFHRGWMSTLPPGVERKIRWDNARRLLQRR